MSVRYLACGPRQREAADRTMDLDFCLLGHLKSVVDLDSQIANRALRLGMPEKKLNSPEVLGASVDQGCLCAALRVGAVGSRIKADLLDPSLDDPRVLTRRRSGEARRRLGNRKSSCLRPRPRIQAPSVSRVCPVISNCTGRCVFCCMTVARAATRTP